MEMQKRRGSSHRWWFESHNTPKSSRWLLTTIAELDEKTKTMLGLIEPDAVSFAERAEMYYKKRPELISMVEEFYRSHRSLAEKFDQVRHDHGVRQSLPALHLHNFNQKSQLSKESDPRRSYDSYTDEPCYTESSDDESEIDDPVVEDAEPVTPINSGEEQPSAEFGSDEMSRLMHEVNLLREENKGQRDQLMQKESKMEELVWQISRATDQLLNLGSEFEDLKTEGTSEMSNLRRLLDAKSDEIIMLREEIERQKLESMTWISDPLMHKNELDADELCELGEEIEILTEEKASQKDLLLQKDEEKREAIRQLSMAMEMLREENLHLKKYIARDATKKRSSPFEFPRFKGLAKFFTSTSVVPV